ncbi:MAG: ATP-dependent DNA helicase RecG [Candidatus Magasanikbacteria bacterium RIFCSPLOWO2_01_FULL_33_34]|nr:MAG: ATP-dependent DNA helicase RecG [Candidatus Magasanikbacteria bacterium RIFCSPHIGHO2_02_FULL_33_17]OGH76356.1 MAG: ATP-dependent DNA helicase RecG [Candidatus Magasanikbacteria bacterium RIFCSPLOWO2_01_FULL_33_34]OGH82274.1 MAG: ATP-dependent DNA helicase RecG [Candidatus Magasanikbacteria bacterium RIFCSPLOWO2_12_FULL_34_7]
MKLSSRISQLNRVGETVEKQLNKLGIKTVEDLLFYYPFRYEDYSNIVEIGHLEIGAQVTIQAEITKIASKFNPRTKRVIIEAEVVDESGVCNVIWFGQKFITKVLSEGDVVNFSGKVTLGKKGIGLISPSYEKIRSGVETAHTGRIVPIYSLTLGISQKQIRFLVSQVISEAINVLDWLTEDIINQVDILSLGDAIRKIHFPENIDDIEIAKKRLKFDELFVLQLRAEMIRQSLRRQKSPEIKFNKEVVKSFLDKLNFTLTDAQKIATWEILQDMEKGEPMNRLLQGDVGAGKTVVAAICANSAIEDGYQVIIMAPTEVLAVQHYESFVELFGHKKNNVCLYTRSYAEIYNDNNIGHFSTLKKRKDYISDKIQKGEIKIAIGTHALLSENIAFYNLGLVVVDEQQRFGVEQRKTIRDKSGNKKTMPHFLSMTATPIPRSLALTLYGDLDVSIIRGLPPGRKKIITKLVRKDDRKKAYDFIGEQVAKGRQVFFVCPLVELTEDNSLKIDQLNKKNVIDEYKKLSENIFPNLRVDYMYGKMNPEEKNKIMEKMSKNEIDILVSTSVIEVGVNIPNASVMVIEDAEKFGLAQLHQFRGRVGRSVYQSYCLLFTENYSQKAQDRLNFFEKNNDGFKLAEFDLAVRGPGEVYGIEQSGVSNLKFAKTSDIELIKKARQLAEGLDFDKFPSLRAKVSEWERTVHLE